MGSITKSMACFQDGLWFTPVELVFYGWAYPERQKAQSDEQTRDRTWDTWSAEECATHRFSLSVRYPPLLPVCGICHTIIYRHSVSDHICSFWLYHLFPVAKDNPLLPDIPHGLVNDVLTHKNSFLVRRIN